MRIFLCVYCVKDLPSGFKWQPLHAADGVQMKATAKIEPTHCPPCKQFGNGPPSKSCQIAPNTRWKSASSSTPLQNWRSYCWRPFARCRACYTAHEVPFLTSFWILSYPFPPDTWSPVQPGQPLKVAHSFIGCQRCVSARDGVRRERLTGLLEQDTFFRRLDTRPHQTLLLLLFRFHTFQVPLCALNFLIAQSPCLHLYHHLPVRCRFEEHYKIQVKTPATLWQDTVAEFVLSASSIAEFAD